MKEQASTTLERDEYRPAFGRYSLDDFDGYHPAPLLLFGPEAKRYIVRAQDKLAWRMVDAAYSETLRYAKPNTALYVARTVLYRMHQREALNSFSYVNRKNREPDLTAVPDVHPNIVLEACHMARLGRGEPLQNEMALRAYGMASGEFANLTVFGEFRRQDEAHMWGAVSKVIGKDATPHPDQMRSLEVQSFDRDPFNPSVRHIGAVRIGMKRTLCTLEGSIDVKARTTAIINLSPSSGFDQDVVQDIRGLAGEKDPQKAIADLPQFRRAIAWLIDASATEGLVLARNETVYAATHNNKPTYLATDMLLAA